VPSPAHDDTPLPVPWMARSGHADLSGGDHERAVSL
jgi:hypothetical protein